MRAGETWKKRWARWIGRGSALLGGLYLVAVLGGWMNPSTPVDYAMNLGTFPRQEELAAADDGKLRLVVLQHGLWRSAGSLWKLERALRAHGYRVFNRSYPSTTRRIEEHADALGKELAAEIREPVDELYFVGHSMGGLVLQAYLRHPDAHEPLASVFLGTPHRGAVLTDLRRDGFLSADAPASGGTFTTPPLTFEGRQLELNVDTSGGGWVQVEIPSGAPGATSRGGACPGWPRAAVGPRCRDGARRPAPTRANESSCADRAAHVLPVQPVGIDPAEARSR